MSISDEDIRKVLDATDIIALIGEHVALKRVGRRWAGLCPFHAEDTPSLSVNAEEGLYYCFGCQAAGNAISFVRAVDRLDFQETVEELARRANVHIERTRESEGPSRGEREQLYSLLKSAHEWFRSNLIDQHTGEAARRYLRERGIGEEAIRHYAIGWAPGKGATASTALKVSTKAYVDAGLGYLDNNGQLKDHFRGRVIFPISDPSGKVIAFGGRILPSLEMRGDGGRYAKYKNSPETVLYSKRRTLFGLSLAREAIVRENSVVVCEGYTDVISFFQAGVEGVVATCGTALSDEHMARLRNFSSRVILAFDADSAGQDAAERLYEMERKHSVSLLVARFPDGMDPAEAGTKDPELLREAVKNATPFLSFRLQRLFNRSELNSAEGRAKAADEALRLISEHPNSLVRNDYLGMVADRCRFPMSELTRRLSVRRGSTKPSLRAPRGGTSFLDHQVDRPSTEALRAWVHLPGAYRGVLTPELFRNESQNALATILVVSENVAEITRALETAEAEVSRLFFELASVPPSDEAWDVIVTLITRETSFELELISSQLRGSSGSQADGLGTIGEIVTIRGLLDGLRGSNVQEAICKELVAWIAQRRRRGNPLPSLA